MRKNQQWLRKLSCVALALAVFTIHASPAIAAAAAKTDTKKATTAQPAKKTTEDISGAISQSYNADKTVQIAMIVELKSKDATTIIPLKDKDIKAMLGVVIPQNNATIVLTPQTIKQQQVLVVKSGRYNVLVNNQNGPIKVGDYLTISAIDGIGMKADDSQEQVIGKAAQDFNGAAHVIGQIKETDTLGKSTNVAISRIPVDISISHNPLYAKTSDKVPGFLSSIALNGG